jgi:hypothetical protein
VLIEACALAGYAHNALLCTSNVYIAMFMHASQVPDEKDDTVKEGFLMFLSFAFFGAMPLIGYVVSLSFHAF